MRELDTDIRVIKFSPSWGIKQSLEKSPLKVNQPSIINQHELIGQAVCAKSRI